MELQQESVILFTNIQHGKGIHVMPEETNESLPEWITTTEAAEIMEVAVSNVRYLCLNKRIECKKFGRNWMVHRQAAENYQKSNRYPSYRDNDESE